MLSAALVYLFVSLTSAPLDDTFSVAETDRPFAGPPQMVRSGGYVYVADRKSGANPNKIRLIRQGQVIEINPRKIRGHPELDFKLQPGDHIVIPDTMF